MKKLILFAAVGLIFASCTKDDLLDQSAAKVTNNDNNAIGFSIVEKNMTRANSAAQAVGHFEFGVYAYTSAATDNKVMDNYLVGFGNNSAEANTTPKAYYGIKANTTWGDATPDAATTDARDGYSSWFYEGLSSTNKVSSTPDHTQVLKFWDKSKATHDFFAYTPYRSKTTAPKVTFDENETFTYEKLSTFYTTPVKNETSGSYALANCKQVSTITEGQASSFTADADLAKYNAEVVNYNEATYAYNQVAKANYDKDVNLTFKHINAKINLKFISAISNYNVTVLDMVPNEITAAEPPATDPKFTINKQNGIVLTPSTQQQASTPMTAAQPTTLPKYVQKADIIAAGVKGTPTLSYSTADGSTVTDNTNLYFQKPAAVGEKSPTWLYVLPNWNGTSYLSNYPDNQKLTGYTVHVTYKLTPKYDDGSTANITVYDARVWLPADVCRWEAGKAYVYLFKITGGSTGTTDPGNEVDPNKDTEPYVDPDDPRVPTDKALTPIVFDGVEVVDYAESDVTPDLEVSSYEFKLADDGTQYFVSANAILNGECGQFGTRQNPTNVFVGAQEVALKTFYDANKADSETGGEHPYWSDWTNIPNAAFETATGTWTWDDVTGFTFTATNGTPANTAYFKQIGADVKIYYTDNTFTAVSPTATNNYDTFKKTYIWSNTDNQVYAVQGVMRTTDNTAGTWTVGFEQEEVAVTNTAPAETTDTHTEKKVKVYDGSNANHAVPDKAYLLYTN